MVLFTSPSVGKTVEFWVEGNHCFYSVGGSKKRGPIRKLVYEGFGIVKIPEVERVVTLPNEPERGHVLLQFSEMLAGSGIEHNILPELMNSNANIDNDFSSSRPLCLSQQQQQQQHQHQEEVTQFSPMSSPRSSYFDGHEANNLTFSTKNINAVNEFETYAIQLACEVEQLQHEKSEIKHSHDTISRRLHELESRLPQEIVQASIDVVCPGCSGVNVCDLWCPSRWHKPKVDPTIFTNSSEVLLSDTLSDLSGIRISPDCRLAEKTSDNSPKYIFSSSVAMNDAELVLSVHIQANTSGRIAVGICSDLDTEKAILLRSDGSLLLAGNIIKKNQSRLTTGSTSTIKLSLKNSSPTVQFYIENESVGSPIDCLLAGDSSKLRICIKLCGKGDSIRITKSLCKHPEELADLQHVLQKFKISSSVNERLVETEKQRFKDLKRDFDELTEELEKAKIAQKRAEKESVELRGQYNLTETAAHEHKSITEVEIEELKTELTDAKNEVATLTQIINDLRELETSSNFELIQVRSELEQKTAEFSSATQHSSATENSLLLQLESLEECLTKQSLIAEDRGKELNKFISFSSELTSKVDSQQLEIESLLKQNVILVNKTKTAPPSVSSELPERIEPTPTPTLVVDNLSVDILGEVSNQQRAKEKEKESKLRDKYARALKRAKERNASLRNSSSQTSDCVKYINRFLVAFLLQKNSKSFLVSRYYSSLRVFSTRRSIFNKSIGTQTDVIIKDTTDSNSSPQFLSTTRKAAKSRAEEALEKAYRELL